MRRKLAHKAKQEPGFRFYALYDRIYRGDVLSDAWLGASSQRCSGVDGMTARTSSMALVRPSFSRTTKGATHGSYRPQPVQRVYIPKPDGRLRPLGIPTVKDRIVKRQLC